MPNKIISIEGNIGSGKSTLLKKLKELLNNDFFVFVPEPITIWLNIKDTNQENILEKFYNNKEKYSFPFQMMAYISRLHSLKEAINNNPDKIIIIERSCFTDKNVFAKMLYDEGHIDEVCYQIYNLYFDYFLNELLENSLHFIFVNTDPTLCHKRIHKRDRTGENIIELSYLEKCHQYHLNWLSTYNQFNLLELDGNFEFETDDIVLKTYLDKIIEFIK